MVKATNTVVELHPKEQREPWEIEWERCKPWLVKAMKYQDTYTIMHILCVSGKFEELEEMFKCIENYAREVGIKKITGSGRKGWLRKIKHLGFKPDYVVSKDL